MDVKLMSRNTYEFTKINDQKFINLQKWEKMVSVPKKKKTNKKIISLN